MKTTETPLPCCPLMVNAIESEFITLKLLDGKITAMLHLRNKNGFGKCRQFCHNCPWCGKVINET